VGVCVGVVLFSVLSVCQCVGLWCCFQLCLFVGVCVCLVLFSVVSVCVWMCRSGIIFSSVCLRVCMSVVLF